MPGLLRKKQLQPSLFFNNAETSFVEYIYSGNFITNIITWTSIAKTQKIHEEAFVYVSNRVSTITTTQYNRVGVLVETLVQTIAYSGNNISTDTRVLT